MRSVSGTRSMALWRCLMTAQSRNRNTRSCSGCPLTLLWKAGHLLFGLEGVVCAPHKLEILAGDEIKAMAKIDDRADHRRRFVIASRDPALCPLLGAKRIRFPEISARAEPIVSALALQDIDVAGHGAVSYGLFAAVICQHE